MPKFTNISGGARGLHTKGGLVMVERGETLEADLAENEEANEEWFAKAGSKAARDAEESADADEPVPVPLNDEAEAAASAPSRRNR